MPAKTRDKPAAAGTHRLTCGENIAARDTSNPAANAVAPNAAQTVKYPVPARSVLSMGRRSPVCRATRMYSSSIGHDEGSIMAIIIACHMRRKKRADAPSARHCHATRNPAREINRANGSEEEYAECNRARPQLGAAGSRESRPLRD